MSEHQMITKFLRPFFQKRKIEPFTVPGVVGNQSRVLAIDTGDLTDLLFYIPLVEGIRRTYPGSKIDFLLPEEHTPLVVPSGLARQCLVYSAKQLQPWRPAFGSLLRNLGKNKYDVAIVMSLVPNPVLELVALASGARLRFGPSHEKAYPGINLEVSSSGAKKGYRGNRIRCVSRFFGLDPETVKPGWPLPEDKLRQMAQLVHFNKPRKEELLVGIDPGVSKTGHGISLSNLHFLIRQLTSQTCCQVLPLTDPGNQDRLKKFEVQLQNPTTGLNRDTLLETILLLSQCDLFVAGNTDLFHFAVAQQVPTIGLFTKQDAQDWDPADQENTRVLRVTKGERVDIDTLMVAVEAVTGGRAQQAMPVVAVAAAETSATENDAETEKPEAPQSPTKQMIARAEESNGPLSNSDQE